MPRLQDITIRRPDSLNVFNTTEEAGASMIPGAAAYGDRGLPAIGQAHQIALEANREIIGLTREIYLNGGLSFPTDQQICYLTGSNNESIHDVIDRQFDVVERHVIDNGLNVYQPFIYSPRSQQFAERLGMQHLTWFNASERINNKAIVQSELRELGVLTPVGKLVKNHAEAYDFISSLAEAGYLSVGVKLVRAASGMGVFEIEIDDILNGNNNIFDKHEEELHRNGLLVDGWIKGEVLGSPNIQFWVDKHPRGDIFVCASNQILKADEGGADKIHIGNISSPELMMHPELVKSCKKIRDYCRANNYTGLIGIDFLHCIENGVHKFYFMEINGRLNGSTTGGVIGGVNNHQHWGVNNGIRTSRSPEEFINKMIRSDLVYSRDSQTGILPTNLSTVSDSKKAMVYVSGSSKEEVVELLGAASELG